MKKQLKKSTVSRLLFVIAISAMPLLGQVSSQSDTVETAVTFKVVSSETQVPVNRRVEVVFQFSREGDLDIEVGQIPEPVLTQFKIKGVTSSNKVIGTPGGRKAVKEIGYILEPEMEGMGYIEPAAISYVDKTTGKTHYLKAQRLGIEILPPVRDESAPSYTWLWIVGFVVVACAGVVVVVQLKKKNRKSDTEEQTTLLEEAYLSELKAEISPEGPDFQSGFETLSKMMRRYLAEKHQAASMEKTTEDLLAELAENEAIASYVPKLDPVFRQADVIKFSGQTPTAAELSRAYTVFEILLEDNLKIETNHLSEEQNQSKRKGRKR